MAKTMHLPIRFLVLLAICILSLCRTLVGRILCRKSGTSNLCDSTSSEAGSQFETIFSEPLLMILGGSAPAANYDILTHFQLLV